MKAIAATSLLATAGLAALSSTPVVSGAAVPDSFERRNNNIAGSSQPIPQLAEAFAKRDLDGPIKVPIKKWKRNNRDTPEKAHAFVKSQMEYVSAKYGAKKSEARRKRQTTGLVDLGGDVQYYAQVSLGTPAQNFNLILDTGSADLWVALNSCTDSQCSGVALYDPQTSSTSISSPATFQIQYGSGAVAGTLYADTSDLAGYTIYNTTLAGVTQLASDTIQAPTSGIMGLAFQQLATSGATPFPEVLYKAGKLSTPAFTFQLARHLDATSQSEADPGGVFTIGEISSDQYSGDITYTNIPSSSQGQEGYWAIPLDSVTVQGTTVSGNSALAAIDTGTTLIGGPSATVQQIYAAIPNSQAVNSGSSSVGYYAYPCSTTVSIAVSFGGKSWTINSEDFNAGSVGQGYCLGAIFATELGANAPDWVFGDAFLKNVFSVFEYNPQRIGFASLVNGVAQTAATTAGAVPSGSAANRAVSAAANVVTNAFDPATSAAPGPASYSSNAGAQGTAIVGGSGLPAPVPAATLSATEGSALTQPSASSSSPTPTTTLLPISTTVSVPSTVSTLASTTGSLTFTSSPLTVATSTSSISTSSLTSSRITSATQAAITSSGGSSSGAESIAGSYTSQTVMILTGLLAALLL